MIVLDCCAAVEIALRSDEGNALAALMRDDEPVASVDLLRAELASVFRKLCLRGEIDGKVVGNYLEAATLLVDDYYPMADLQVEALRESIRLEHSVYDLFYFVLARRLGATLFTLDEKLMALCEKHGVDCIGMSQGDGAFDSLFGKEVDERCQGAQGLEARPGFTMS